MNFEATLDNKSLRKDWKQMEYLLEKTILDA